MIILMTFSNVTVKQIVNYDKLYYNYYSTIFYSRTFNQTDLINMDLYTSLINECD